MQRGKNVAIFDLSKTSKAISRKRCKKGGKLLLMTNRKSHMSFRLLPNSVTLNDLERRNRPNGCVISPNSIAFRADCVKVVEDTRMRQKCGAKECSFYDSGDIDRESPQAIAIKLGTPSRYRKFDE